MKVRTRPYAQSRLPEDELDEDEDAIGDDNSNNDLSSTPSPSAESSGLATPASNKLLQLCSQAVSDNS